MKAPDDVSETDGRNPAATAPDTGVPGYVAVVVELPAWSVVKRRAGGQVDFVSPVPCPFNYGYVPDTQGSDGDPVDAVVLGPRLSAGTRATWPVRGVVRFEDAGRTDDKLICGPHPVSRRRRAAILAFFHVYAGFKRVLNRSRGLAGPTRVLGWRAQSD